MSHCSRLLYMLLGGSTATTQSTFRFRRFLSLVISKLIKTIHVNIVAWTFLFTLQLMVTVASLVHHLRYLYKYFKRVPQENENSSTSRYFKHVTTWKTTENLSLASLLNLSFSFPPCQSTIRDLYAFPACASLSNLAGSSVNGVSSVTTASTPPSVVLSMPSPLGDPLWLDVCKYVTLDPGVYFATAQPSSFTVIWDSGASEVITSDPTDFVNGYSTPTTPLRVRGVSSGTLVVGIGIVEYCFTANNGNILTVRLKAFYIPGALPAGIRLIPPQRLCSIVGGSFTLEGACAILRLPKKSPLTIYVDPHSNLPTCTAMSSTNVLAVGKSIHLCVTDESNQNLSVAQKLLITWHFRFGHLNFKAVQWILRSGIFGKSQPYRSASSCDHPRCAACEFGKARRRPTKSSITTPVPERENVLKTDVLFPGQRVSLDHFECSAKGRLLTSMGKSSLDDMYRGGAIFVDQASGYIFIQPQVTFSATETLQAKLTFERMCLSSGVVVSTYMSDNGTFSAQDFVQDILDRGQTPRYSGVGAHHHNGIAERSIQTMSNMARTMMLHAGVRWPDLVDASLWPLAMDYASYIYNHTPNMESGQAPIDIFTRTIVPRQRLKDLHVWGCPTYVLEPKLQDGKKIPRWKPRSRRGVFLGLANKYASSIPLVLNPSTGHISPQFHVVFDDLFTTVVSQPDSDEPPSHWEDLCITSRFQTHFDENDPVRLDDEWLSSDEIALRKHQDSQQRIVLPQPVPIIEPESQPFNLPVLNPNTLVEPALVDNAPTLQRELTPPSTPAKTSPVKSPPPTPAIKQSLPEQQPSRPSRVRRKPIKLNDYELAYGSFAEANSFFANLPDVLRDSLSQKEYELDELEFFLTDYSVSNVDPTSFVYLASKSDPDTLMYHEAMMAIDKVEFREAMEIEIKGLELQNTWTIVSRNVPTQLNKKVLPGTWTFKRKRYPDGRIRKYKARFCVRGDKQVVGIDVFETYAPVVQWSSVRLCFILSTILGLASRQVDYTNAFVQAKVKSDMFVELPKGFDPPSDNSVVLRLNKNLYGSRDAPLAWFETLRASLIKRGFKASDVDPCLFIHKDMLVLCFVDDLIYVGSDVAKIDAMIANLGEEYQLTVEEDISSFLGIQIDTLSDKALLLTQSGLTHRVLDTCLMTDCNAKDTPASSTTLGSDLSGAVFNNEFSYASAVGMLMYLASNSRPDIAFAVHQCARFTHSPKASHGEAIKRICRYLKGTLDKGLILRPARDNMRLDVYVDSDFAGLWKQEDDQDPVCVKSRTGFVILLADCPLVWQSKLQGQVALSTMEAEYIALSTSLRSLIPLKALVAEVATSLMEDSTFLTSTYSSVFEDNTGALLLAQSPRISPRSKHIAVPYHFFREHVANGTIQIHKVASEVNPADLFTKGLERVKFQALRKLLTGW